MPVEVAEVAGIDTPRSIARCLSQRRSCRFGLREYSVNLGPVGHTVSDAEFSGLWRPEWNVRVLGEFAAGYRESMSPASISNIAAAPAGLISSPSNSVPITPGETMPRSR